MSQNKIKLQKRDRRRTLRALLAWTITGVLLAFFLEPLYNRMWIGVSLLVLGFALVGILLFLIAVIYAIWRKQLQTALVAMGFIINGLVLSLITPYLAPLGDVITVRLGFILKRSLYDQVVARRLSASSTRINSQGIPVDTETNSPVRVAITKMVGFKEYESIVYDPAKSNIEHCFHLEGNYYYCGADDLLDN